MTRIAALALALGWLLGGCIEQNLVACGDVECPAGAVCLAASSRCVSPEQLASCAALNAGDPCTIDGAGGRCEDGACTPIACGNGVLDPGEVCDDGNTISGDGCSGNCLSNETCGNGVVDVAQGEGCDCGSTGSRSAACSQANSDDPSAECTTACQPRFCGDGHIDLSEQCDGAVPDADSCTQFGYYGGQLTCSSICQLDPASCVGRCGDGVVQADHGEFCDGSVPAGQSCVGFGYDLGAMTCGAGCGPDLATCGQLGFVGDPQVTGHVKALYGGGGLVGLLTDDGSAFARHGEGWDVIANPYDAIAGSKTTLWVAGPGHVAHWTAAGGWVDADAPWPAGTVASIWASDTLGVFVALADSAPLWHLQGSAWTTVSGSWDDGVKFGDTHTNLWVMTDPIQVWDGAAWSDPGVSGFQAFEDERGGLWVPAGIQLMYEDPHATTPAWATLGGAIEAWGGGVDGVYTTAGECALQCSYDLGYIGSHPFGTITDDIELASGDGLGDVFGALAGGGIEIARYGVWGSDGAQSKTPHFLRAPGGPLVRTDPTPVGPSSATSVLGSDGEWRDASNGWSCVAAAMTAAGSLYCADAADGELLDQDDAGVTGIDPEVLWIGSADVATVGAHSFAWRTGGAWSTLAPPFVASELAGDAVNDLYAIAIGDDDAGVARIWHFDGGAWSSVTDPIADLADLTVVPGAVVARAGSALVQYSRTTGATSSPATPAPLVALVHTSGAELFALAGSARPRSSRLWRFDGTQWTPVAMTQGAQGADSLRTDGTSLWLGTSVAAYSGLGFDVLYRVTPW